MALSISKAVEQIKGDVAAALPGDVIEQSAVSPVLPEAMGRVASGRRSLRWYLFYCWHTCGLSFPCRGGRNRFHHAQPST